MAKVFRYTYGFNFIEILMVLVIIALLATFGLPLFTQFLIKERRLEAGTVLSKLAYAMEQYKLENNTYQGATLKKLHFPELIVRNQYHLIISYATDNDYLLIANPLGKQAENDQKCLALTLNAVGEKGVNGTGTVNDCW